MSRAKNRSGCTRVELNQAARAWWPIAAGFLILGVLLLPAPALGQEPGLAEKKPFTLARAGKAEVVLVVPAESSPVVRFAADELKHFLDRMTGASFRIVTARPREGRAIVLGDCAAARAQGIEVAKIKRDGYVIKTVADTIYIAGKDDNAKKGEILKTVKGRSLPKKTGKNDLNNALGDAVWDFERGTLYGAYRFIEELGVRWFFPGPKGTVIPIKKRLEVRIDYLREEPVYDLRVVGSRIWPRPYGWSRLKAPAEYADFGWTRKANRLWLLRLRASSKWLSFNHRPVTLWWEKRFSKTHPEYFALLPSGKRDLKRLGVKGRTSHLCYTNEGVFQQTINDIAAYFSGKNAQEYGIPAHPERKYEHNRGWSSTASYGNSVSLLPHDSYRACQGQACKTLMRKNAPYWGQHSELVWQFVNRVGEEVKKRFPGKIVSCLAYSTYTAPPKKIAKLPDNVLVGVCPKKLNKTYNIVDDKSYDQYFDLVRQWRKKAGRPLMAWSHHLYRYRQPHHYGVPMLLPHSFKRWFKDFSRYGRMMHIEIDQDDLMFEHLNRYIMLKLLYNPDLDVGLLLDDYAKNLYGPAAEIVRNLLGDIERRCEDIARNHSGRIDTWEKYFSADVLKAYRHKVDRAVTITRGTRYAAATRLLSVYFVGLMEKGHARYVHDVRDVLKTKRANVSFKWARGPIKIDGDLSDDAWKHSRVRKFTNNVDGEKTKWKTEVRLLWDKENVYFAFTCYDPNAKQLSGKQGEADYVEIFLDPQHDHDSYIQVLIDISGRVQNFYYEGGGEPPDITWKSGAKVAVKRHADRWIMEVVLPRKNIPGGMTRTPGVPWGANFCRTLHNPPQPQDRFSCFSPLLRGNFAQPDLFGHIFFAN